MSMKRTVFSVCAATLFALAALPGPASAGGTRIYKDTGGDLKITLAVKNGRIKLRDLDTRLKCNYAAGSTSPSMNESSFKIRRGGRFIERDVEDFGMNWVKELKGTIHKRIITGSYYETYSARQNGDGSGGWNSCWTGRSESYPKVTFRARLVN